MVDTLQYHTHFGTGGINAAPMMLLMNSDAYANLPDDLQAVMDKCGAQWRDAFLAQDQGLLQTVVDRTIAAGHTVNELTSEQIQEWRTLVENHVHRSWVLDAEARGLPGQAIYDALVERGHYCPKQKCDSFGNARHSREGGMRIPTGSDHRFRFIEITQSDLKRSVIPV